MDPLKTPPPAETKLHFLDSWRIIRIRKTVILAVFLLVVVTATLVDPTDEVMLITTGGVLIRTRIKEIREMGRTTQGVTLIKTGNGEKLAGIEKIVEPDDAVE